MFTSSPHVQFIPSSVHLFRLLGVDIKDGHKMPFGPSPLFIYKIYPACRPREKASTAFTLSAQP